MAGGDISPRLPFLRSACRCPALIPVGPKPIGDCVLSFYEQRSGYRPYLVVDAKWRETLTEEMPHWQQGRNLLCIEETHGVLESLAAALALVPGTEELEVVVNLVTTIPTIELAAQQVHLGEDSHDFGPWSSIELQGGAISYHKKSDQIEAGQPFTGVFRTRRGLLENALKSVDQVTDLLSVVEVIHAWQPWSFVASPWIDCGHEAHYYESRARLTGSRSFNAVQIDSQLGLIRKSSAAKSKLAREVKFMQGLPPEIAIYFPRIIATEGPPDALDAYSMEYYGYPTIAEYQLYWDLSSETWGRVFKSLERSLQSFRSFPFSIGPQLHQSFYLDKTLQRVEAYRSQAPQNLFTGPLQLNGVSLRGWDELAPLLPLAVGQLYREEDICIMHGDFCFNNILFDVLSGVVRLIDPRGSMVESHPAIYGDRKYDLAKLCHSSLGHYDYLVNGLYDLQRASPGQYELQVRLRPNAQMMARLTRNLLTRQQASFDEIQLITGLLFVSMVPLHEDSASRQQALFPDRAEVSQRSPVSSGVHFKKHPQQTLMARICLDLDGVIAELKRSGQTYADLAPVPGAVAKLQALRAAGHYLIIQTARHMKTCGANVGLVNARVTEDTLAWLRRHEIPYDEIYFGKPWAQIYIDDNGFRFQSWEDVADDGSNLPGYREDAVQDKA